MTVETSPFAGEGHESFPSLHADEQLIGSFSEWTTEVLEERAMVYGKFLAKPQMPRATKEANHILDHLLFELAYRDGIYDEFLDSHIEDEACNE